MKRESKKMRMMGEERKCIGVGRKGRV